MAHPLLRTAVPAAGLLAGLAVLSPTTSAAASSGTDPTGRGFRAAVVLNGSDLTHRVGGHAEALSHPDDILLSRGHLFVAFQNGVGPKGEASATGNSASTIVEATSAGHVVHQWDVVGKVDGMGADPESGTLVATVNEDGSSSLYTVDPSAGPGSQISHYAYDQDPLAHGGGTDAVSFDHGELLVSASAPTVADGPAVYAVALHAPAFPGATGTAYVTTLFTDTAAAAPADPGAPSRLALTDPDSNTVVPAGAPRFGGDFMLDSQGDQQQVYVSDPGSASQSLSVLALDQSVDDTAFVTSDRGVLYATDPAHGTVDAVTGPFRTGQAFSAVTPCGANSAPATCPAPGFPADYLATLDLGSGTLTAVTVGGTDLHPQGLVFAAEGNRGHQGGPGRH